MESRNYPVFLHLRSVIANGLADLLAAAERTNFGCGRTQAVLMVGASSNIVR